MKQSNASSPSTRWEMRLRSLSSTLSAVVALMGLAVLLGWVFDLPLLTRIVPGLPSMKANTALCFILAGVSLGLEQWAFKLKPTLAKLISLVCAIGVILIAGLTLVQYGFDLNLEIDELLWPQPEPVGSTVAPGRMASNTAIAFLLLGSALALNKRWQANPNAVQLFVLSSGAIALLGLLGHVYGNVDLFTIASYRDMAIHTAIAFLLINLGVLCDQPKHGLMRHISGNGTDSLVARRLLPLGFIVPLLVGGLVTIGYRLNLFSAEAANALQGIFDVIVFTSLISWSIYDIERLDRRRRHTEQVLENSELKFRAVFDQSFQWIALLRTDGVLIEANQQLQTFVAAFGQDAMGFPFWHLPIWSADQQLHIQSAVHQALQGETVRFECPMRADENTVITHDITLKSIKNDGDNPLFLMVEGQDISDRKRTDDERKRSEASLRRYERIISATTDAIALIDRDYCHLVVNQAYLNWHQKTSDALMGRSVVELLGADLVEKNLKPHFEKCLTGETVQLEHWVSYPELGPQFISVTYAPYTEPDTTVSAVVVSLRNITTVKQAEEALRQSEERLQLAFEASGDGFWDWNIETDEVYLSPRYFEMLDYSPNELPSTLGTWQSLVHPDDLPWVKDVLTAHFQNSSVRYGFDYRLRTKSGAWKWIADYGKVVRWDETGKPTRMLGTHRDINDRKQAEIAQAASEERWQLALRGNNDGIWDWNIQTDEVFFSSRWKEMLGYKEHEISNDNEEWRRRIHPDDRSRVMQLTRDHLAQKTPFYAAEYRFQTKDGSHIWILDRGQALWDETGKPVRMIGSHTDISDRKQAENALRASEAKFRSLSEFSPLGIFLTDKMGQCTYINPRYFEIIGGTVEPVLGKSWVDFLHPDDQIGVAQKWAIAIAQHQSTFCQEVRYLQQDGSIRYVKVYTSPIKTAEETVLGYVGTLDDLTQHHAIEQMKKDFISVVSHELRTPLTAIHGSLGLLAGGVYDNKPEKRQMMLDIAANQTDRLVRLVNDILNLGRLESGNLKLVMQICDPTRLMQQSVDELRAYAAEHHIVLKMTSTDTPVWAAPDSIIQTLTNLISNAIKFSPPNATVSISAERVDPALTTTAHSGDRQSTAVLAPPSLLSSYVLFKVQDQGRGIPADKLDAIFEQFQQVDASDSREKGGTGLGLAICRNIVQQHGGQIGVNSTLGQGSTFYFTLRLPPDSFKDKL